MVTTGADGDGEDRCTVQSGEERETSVWSLDGVPVLLPVLDDGDEPARTSLVDDAERAVRRWLAPGRFRVGDRLPTEERLAGMLGISRGTLRSALSRLETTGEIVRRQGSGTFVGRRRTLTGAAGVPWLRADSFSARIRAGSLTVGELSVAMVPVGRQAATAFGVDPERRGVRIERLTVAGGEPVAVSVDVLHPDLTLPDLELLRRELRASITVHAMLVATMGIAFSHQRIRIASVLVDPAERVGRMLGLRALAACVTMEEVSTAAGRSVHWASDVLAPGQVEIEVLQSAGDTRPDPIIDRLGGSGDGDHG